MTDVMKKRLMQLMETGEDIEHGNRFQYVRTSEYRGVVYDIYEKLGRKSIVVRCCPMCGESGRLTQYMKKGAVVDNCRLLINHGGSFCSFGYTKEVYDRLKGVIDRERSSNNQV